MVGGHIGEERRGVLGEGGGNIFKWDRRKDFI